MSIPSSLTKIAIGTFNKCLSLTEIEIPSSVKSIEECAFINYRSLQHEIIPVYLSLLIQDDRKNTILH